MHATATGCWHHEKAIPPGAVRTRHVSVEAIRREIRMYRQLFELAHVRLWFLPTMIVLALLESMFEGLSLALIIPLMHSLNDGAANQAGFAGAMHALVDGIPAESRVAVLVGAILGAVLLKAFINYTNMIVLAIVSGQLSHALRLGIFNRIITMPLPVWERERSGRHFNILDNETWRATDALSTLFGMVTNLSTFVVLCTLLMLLSWQLTLIALLCMALVPALMHFLNRYIVQVRDFGYKANESLSKNAWGVLSGLRTIHSFGREDFETHRFVENSTQLKSFLLRVALVTLASAPVTEVLITAVVAAIALAIDITNVAVSTLVGFLAILYRLQPRVLSLAYLQTRLVALRTAVVEVTKVLNEGAAHARPTGERPFPGLSNEIAFRNVTFSYPTAGRPALTDVSFTATHGSTVAIVGLSGAGKSTLLDLLMRFQEPQQGAILVDGVALSEFDVKSWRTRVAIVNQDPYLFDDTVLANILYGRPEATPEDAFEAARIACADEFIRDLPNGYDTLIGDRGTQISGGQRQRLSLARALIRNAEILILDEATSALDAVTERALQQALKSSARKRTTIVVAHRLSMIEPADHCIVLEEGRLIEEGNPRVLLREGGALARIFHPEHTDASDGASVIPIGRRYAGDA